MQNKIKLFLVDDDVVFIEFLAYALRVKIHYPGAAVSAVGLDTCLGAGQAYRIMTETLQGHGQQRTGDNFSG